MKTFILSQIVLREQSRERVLVCVAATYFFRFHHLEHIRTRRNGRDWQVRVSDRRRQQEEVGEIVRMTDLNMRPKGQD